MKILVGFECSQVVCSAFRAAGHTAYSCDIKPCAGTNPEWHITADVLPLLNGNCTFTTDTGETVTIIGKWDMLILHPECTYLTNAGTRSYSLKCNPPEKVAERIEKRQQAFTVFMQCINADCEKIAVENPVGYPNSAYRKPDMIVHPFYFADETDTDNYQMKRTCFWLKGLPVWEFDTHRKKPEPYYQWTTASGKLKNIHYCEYHGKTQNGYRATGEQDSRSMTFPVIAQQMVKYWG